jgi:hypothetical protein
MEHMSVYRTKVASHSIRTSCLRPGGRTIERERSDSINEGSGR